MLEDLIIETETIDTTDLSDVEKSVIDSIEETQTIQFDLTRNIIYYLNNEGRISFKMEFGKVSFTFYYEIMNGIFYSINFIELHKSKIMLSLFKIGESLINNKNLKIWMKKKIY